MTSGYCTGIMSLRWQINTSFFKNGAPFSPFQTLTHKKREKLNPTPQKIKKQKAFLHLPQKY